MSTQGDWSRFTKDWYFHYYFTDSEIAICGVRKGPASDNTLSASMHDRCIDCQKKLGILRSRGKVYLIHAMGTNFYKVGITSGDPLRRLHSIQGGNPFKLKLEEWCETHDYAATEKTLHRLLSPYRTDGGSEWFALPLNVVGILKQMFSSPEGLNQAIECKAERITDLTHVCPSCHSELIVVTDCKDIFQCWTCKTLLPRLYSSAIVRRNDAT